MYLPEAISGYIRLRYPPTCRMTVVTYKCVSAIDSLASAAASRPLRTLPSHSFLPLLIAFLAFTFSSRFSGSLGRIIIMPVKREAVDPITLLLSPPPNETAEERVIRLQKEAEARKISENIDEQLRRESAALKKRNVLRMLLLGQSESGKSTTLKNIQLIQAPEAWQAERASWRIVIQLNLVRAVNTILDILSSEAPATPARAYDSWSMSPSVNLSLATADDSQWHDDPDFCLSTSPPSPPPLKPSVLPLSFTAAHAALRLRLTPLRRIEADLKLLLGAASDEVTEASLNGDHSTMVATPFDSGAYPLTHSPSRRPREFCVRSHDTWKDSVLKQTSTKTLPRRASLDMDANGVIAGCREDIWFLWKDEVIREALRRQKIVLEDSAEYFLNQADRIATLDYEPTDDDVLRARLRTVGVQEYRIPLERGNSLGKEWCIYDVGGARSMRRAWLPYFDNMHAILFLAPISCFDEHLTEDPRVNRLKDSFILWKSIVGSKLLAKCIFILFLNKCDLLEKKLKAGVVVSKYIPRYGNRENKSPVFGKYIRDKFKDYMKEYSPVPHRPFYGYMTSVINTKATAATLRSIQDGIFRANLEDGALV